MYGKNNILSLHVSANLKVLSEPLFSFRATQDAPYSALMGVVVDGRIPDRVSIITTF